jgi:hypothetical protein
MLSIACEYELELKLGVLQDAKYVWSIVRGWSTHGDEMYKRYYERYFGSATATLLAPKDPG